MFTGIVQAVGRIDMVTPRADGVRLVVDAGTQSIGNIGAGDSVAVAGC